MVTCGECSYPLPAEAWNREEGVACPGCRNRVLALVFPAMERKQAGAAPETLGAESEASCFFHANARAAFPCAECGRFLCNLCDIQLDGRHICPSCFQSGVRSNKLQTMETHRVMYDTIALASATLPVLLIWPAVVGAPAAIYIAIRRWRTPLSILPRTKIRFVIAVLFALGEIAFVAVVIWAILKVPQTRHG